MTRPYHASGLSPFAFAYTYNAANQRTRFTREDNAYWDFSYDSLGQVTAGRKKLSTGEVMLGYDYAFAFDDIGNRTTTMVNSHASTYTLDTTKLNQYTQRTVPGFVDVFGSAKPGAFVTANYQSMTRQGGGFYTGLAVINTTTPQYLSVSVVGVKNNAGPNGEDAVSADTRTAFVPQTPEAFTYDADGNLLTDGRWTCTWDAENRLISMVTNAAAATAGAPQQKLEFAYDARGRRIQKKVSNWNGSAYVLASDTRFLYDGWNMIAELDALSSDAVVRSYVWGTDLSGSMQGGGGVGGLLAMNVTTGSATHYPAYDGNGNIIALVNAADGTQSADYEYGPFGDTIKALGAAAPLNPFAFSTKYVDAESNLSYYGFRYYSPSTGRWLSRDPIGEQGGLNLYSFLDNQSTDAFDPIGSSPATDALPTLTIDTPELFHNPGTPTKRAGSESIEKLRDLMQEKCLCCVPSNPNGCKEEAGKIVDKLKALWEASYIIAILPPRRTAHNQRDPSVGGRLCWKWAVIFKEGVDNVGTTYWKGSFRRFASLSGPTVHFALRIGIVSPNTTGCDVSVDDGFFEDGLSHDSGWPKRSDYRETDKNTDPRTAPDIPYRP